ncbi:DUF4873 domain-containing protein [Micromonospora aurantiaca (nom. illeg.)]
MTWEGTARIAGTTVRLHGGGRFEPVDGRYHWAGRVEPEPRLVRLLRSGRRDVEVRIGERVARPGWPRWTRGAASASPASARHPGRRTTSDPRRTVKG